jgi:O-antigen/teichoic acid export membrane protein
MRQPLFANAGYLLGVNVVGGLVGFVFWGLAARMYRPEDVGTASAIVSAVGLVAGIAGLGVSIGLVRFLPTAHSPDRLLNTAFTFNAATALLAGGIYLAGLGWWSPSLIFVRRNALYAAGFLAYVVTMILGTAVQAAFVARRQAGYALIHTCVANGERMLLLVVLAGLGAVGLAGSMALSMATAVALSLALYLPKAERAYRPRPCLYWPDLARIVPYSIGNYVTVLLTRTSQMVLPLVVMEPLGAASSGYTYVAWMLGSLLISPGMALARSAFAEGANAPQRLAAILSRAATLALVLTVPASIVTWVIAPWLLLLFGSSYAQEGAALLRWLAVAAPLAVLSGLYYTYLRVRKQVGLLIVASGIVAGITLVVAALWMSRLGIAAIGIGWLAGNGLVAVVGASVIWKETLRERRAGRVPQAGEDGGVGIGDWAA